MDWYQTDSKSQITREIHAVKKNPWEFHYNESENISGESIGGAALIWGRGLLTFLSQMRSLFEGGAYSNKYGILLIFFIQPIKSLICGVFVAITGVIS